MALIFEFIDVDNAMLDLYKYLMNTKIAVETLNIMKGFKCVEIIASDKPTGMLDFNISDEFKQNKAVDYRSRS